MARTNQPGVPVYILTDISLPAVSGTQEIRSIDSLKTVPLPAVIVLACNSDELALAAVRIIRARAGLSYYGADRPVPPARYFHRDENARTSLKVAHQANLARYDLPDFENIAQALQGTRELPGCYVEIGVYKGSSAYFALDYMERAGIRRQCYFLDTFTGFDYGQAASSSDRTWVNTHTDASREIVEQFLSGFKTPHQVIVNNIITDALPPEIREIALCNIDVDMYEAIAAALARVAPLMIMGGIIIAEDQGHTPLLVGAYVAVRDFLDSAEGKKFLPIEMMSGQMFLVKVRI